MRIALRRFTNRKLNGGEPHYGSISILQPGNLQGKKSPAVTSMERSSTSPHDLACRANPVMISTLSTPQEQDMRRALHLLPGLLIVSLLFVACSSSGPANRRPPKKVTVTVNYKGVPVEGANVTFINQG